ncbi:hypothetical protein BHM03_00040558 [Ensete ventricosum]|nr:hypothetical protein BHM03_00040558 [Ensete ventricosum]
MRFPAGGLVMYVRGEAGRAGARSYPSTRSRQRLQGRDHQPPQRLRLGTPHLGFFLMLDLPLSPCCDFFGLGGQPMLNSAKSDRIFSSKRLSKASNSVLMASSDAMV